jgi:hypothetical protein
MCVGQCNLQHKDYDNSLVKENCWKEIAGELHCAVGEWQGSGRAVACEQHGMCKLASAIQRRHVGDLPSFGLFRLPHKEFQEGYHQRHTNLRCRWPV